MKCETLLSNFKWLWRATSNSSSRPLQGDVGGRMASPVVVPRFIGGREETLVQQIILQLVQFLPAFERNNHYFHGGVQIQKETPGFRVARRSAETLVTTPLRDREGYGFPPGSCRLLFASILRQSTGEPHPTFAISSGSATLRFHNLLLLSLALLKGLPPNTSYAVG